MKLSRENAVLLCEAAGYSTARTWNKSRMMRKLKDVYQLAVDDGMELEDEKLTAMLEALVAAKGEVILTNENPTKQGPKVKEEEKEVEEKPKAKKKPKAKEVEVEEKPKAKQEPKPKKESKLKKKSKLEASDAPKSNKQIVYEAWIEDGIDDNSNAEKYHTLVEERVKLMTIKEWISTWRHGKDLPACAKKGA